MQSPQAYLWPAYRLFPDGGLASELAERLKAKYGYGTDPAGYTKTGVWRLSPDRVLAWTQFPRDATRFVFRGSS